MIDIEKTDDATLWQQLQTLAHETGDTLKISHLPTDKAPYHRPTETAEQLRARPFLGNIDKTWKVTSFTALTKQSGIADKIDKADQPDHDETPSFRFFERAKVDENHILSFPRGARAGSFMHALFENLDFLAPEPDPDFIDLQLANFGYHTAQWKKTITKLIFDVLNTALEPEQPHFTLSRIGFDKRLNELEFYHPLAKIMPSDLRAAFAEFGHQNLTHFAEEINRLAFAPVRGFMKGYIDMVFEYEGRYYVVDYKSNMLGFKQENYHHSHLNAEMAQAGYLLQYHIYVVALHRYLSTRIPDYHYETHFGGVYYLFLRGMNPDWGANYGIYRDKPAVALIDKLDRVFFGEGKYNELRG
jgi:exodeoxyribonuclease V beta subunit